MKRRRLVSKEFVRTCPDCNIEHQSPGYCGYRCLTCFKSLETLRKKLWREANRAKDRERLDRYAAAHREKRLKYAKAYMHSHVEEFKEYRRNLKREIVVKLGGGCKHCGYSKNLAALSFHHLGDKDNTISSLLRAVRPGSTKIREKLNFELSKCILLCSNCHHEEHHPDQTET